MDSIFDSLSVLFLALFFGRTVRGLVDKELQVRGLALLLLHLVLLSRRGVFRSFRTDADVFVVSAGRRWIIRHDAWRR